MKQSTSLCSYSLVCYYEILKRALEFFSIHGYVGAYRRSLFDQEGSHAPAKQGNHVPCEPRHITLRQSHAVRMAVVPDGHKTISVCVCVCVCVCV